MLANSFVKAVYCGYTPHLLLGVAKQSGHLTQCLLQLWSWNLDSFQLYVWQHLFIKTQLHDRIEIDTLF